MSNNSTSQEDTRYEEFVQTFERMKAAIVQIKEQAEHEGLIHAPSFNVFEVLNLSRYETRTHSAMLAHLLDPAQSHGQGYLFLKAFLEYCHKKDASFPLPWTDLDAGHWQVVTEEVTNIGRLDIVLRSPDLNYLCVIENKVDAWEQPEQLKRYGGWLERQRQEYPDQVLIYLTPSGSQAYTAQDFPYLALSYHEDIAAWLSRSLEGIQAPGVRVIIQQYINLAHTL